jgi:hypothetical protein
MAAPGWEDLTRPEQRLLIKLFGGGTTRRDDPRVVEGLRGFGFLDENDQLSMPGLRILTPAMREQQAVARARVVSQ